MATISEYLGQDHRCCDNLFERVERSVVKAQWEEAEPAFRSFDEAMQRHMAMEETVLFPAFESATGMASGPTRVMREEHRQIRGLLAGIDFTLKERDAVGFDGHAETLNILLQQHNIKEEGMLYPMSDRALSGKRQEIIDAMHHITGVIASCDMAD